MAKSERKRGLGRGLSALMSDVATDPVESSGQSSGSGQTTLPIELIQPNPDQPRKRFEPSDLNDLAASIREKGIIQPLVVRAMDDGSYQIVAGERRWRAAQMANLHEVPAVIREFSDVEVIEIAIIENIQRADLNSIEEASGYRQLMDKFGHTQEKLAEALGKSRSHIANTLRLLTLPKSIRDFVESGQLSAGHARALITADAPLELAKKVVAEGLSVRATEELAKAPNKPKNDNIFRGSGSSNGPEKDADTRALEGDLSAALGMHVTLNHAPGNEGGTLSIRYATLDQLDELCRALSGA